MKIKRRKKKERTKFFHRNESWINRGPFPSRHFQKRRKKEGGRTSICPKRGGEESISRT